MLGYFLHSHSIIQQLMGLCHNDAVNLPKIQQKIELNQKDPFTGSTQDPQTLKLLHYVREKYQMPGLAVLVTKGGSIVQHAAVGIRKYDQTIQITKNDIFHIGSCTKSMTGVLSALIVQQGKLRWDSSILEVFPQFKGRIRKQYENVTLEMLVKNHGGLKTELTFHVLACQGDFSGQNPTATRLKVIQKVLNQPCQAIPGTKFIYSNQGFFIVGAMLERVTQIPFQQLMDKFLFRQLGMKSAGFGHPGQIGKIQQPHGHRLQQGLLKSFQEDNPTPYSPAGRVHCTLEDLSKYTQLVLNKSKNLIKSKQNQQMLYTPYKESNYAAGWNLFERQWGKGVVLFHAGSNSLWFMTIWIACEIGLSVISVCNTGKDDVEKGLDEINSAMVGKWSK